MTLYNMTHQADLDGMASAALLVRYYGMDVRNVSFAEHDEDVYNDGIAEIGRIKGKGHTLVVTDFAMERPKLGRAILALKKFRRNGNRVIWLDHHEWEKSVTSALSKYCDFMIVGENLKFCGAELVYNVLCPHDSAGDRIVRITHLHDFWVRSGKPAEDRLVDEYAYGIKDIRSRKSWKKGLRSLILSIADGDMDNKIISSAYGNYVRRTAPYLKRVLQTCTIAKIGGLRVGIGLGDKVSSQEVCAALNERKGCDIAVFISTRQGSGSIRAREDADCWGVDIVPLAKALGGGGHPHASGFFLADQGYNLGKKEDRERAKQKVLSLCAKIYSRKIPYWQKFTGRTRVRAPRIR